MEKGLRFSLDKEADILDISIGKPMKAISREMNDDFFVRLHPKTKKVVGFSILNFQKWAVEKKRKNTIPIKAEFLLTG